MATKIAKTSHGKDQKVKFFKPCPICGTGLVATRHQKTAWSPKGGMFFDCPKEDYSERIKR